MMILMIITKWFDVSIDENTFFFMCFNNISFDYYSLARAAQVNGFEFISSTLQYIQTIQPVSGLAVAIRRVHSEITDYRLVVQVL